MSASAGLRAGTFNIRYDNPSDGDHSWRHRRSAVRTCIESLRCDVLGLQEVLPVQRRYLEPRLAGTRWYGVGRTDGKGEGEQSPLLVGDRVQVDRWDTMWLSDTPDVPGSKGVDARTPRIATVLRGSLAGAPIGVVNTHFDHRGGTSRELAAEQIAELVERDERAWIVCGDFNVTLEDHPMRVLLARGLTSVLDDSATGTFHAFRGGSDGARIDHLLVNAGWSVERGWIDTSRPGGVIPSDHWPVVADLRLASGR